MGVAGADAVASQAVIIACVIGIPMTAFATSSVLHSFQVPKLDVQTAVGCDRPELRFTASWASIASTFPLPSRSPNVEQFVAAGVALASFEYADSTPDFTAVILK